MMETEKLLQKLDTYSSSQLDKTYKEMVRVLEVDVELRKMLFNRDINWWEWVVNNWNDKGIPPKRFIALKMLFDSIMGLGIKDHIIANINKDGSYFIRNGYHRLAIAQIYNIPEILIEFRES